MLIFTRLAFFGESPLFLSSIKILGRQYTKRRSAELHKFLPTSLTASADHVITVDCDLVLEGLDEIKFSEKVNVEAVSSTHDDGFLSEDNDDNDDKGDGDANNDNVSHASNATSATSRVTNTRQSTTLVTSTAQGTTTLSKRSKHALDLLNYASTAFIFTVRVSTLQSDGSLWLEQTIRLNWRSLTHSTVLSMRKHGYKTYTNGFVLVMCVSEACKKAPAQFLKGSDVKEMRETMSYFSFDLETGEEIICKKNSLRILEKNQSGPVADEFLPDAFVFDANNNVIWGYDWAKRQSRFFHNSGLRPCTFPADLPSTSRNFPFLSVNPSVRLSALYDLEQQLDENDSPPLPTLTASVIMTNLARLSAPFLRPPDNMNEELRRNQNWVSVTSTGGADGVPPEDQYSVRFTVKGVDHIR